MASQSDRRPGNLISEMACHARPTDLWGPGRANLHLHNGQSQCSRAGCSISALAWADDKRD